MARQQLPASLTCVILRHLAGSVLLNTPNAEKNILDGLHDPRPLGRFPAPAVVGRRRHHPHTLLCLVGSLPQ